MPQTNRNTFLALMASVMAVAGACLYFYVKLIRPKNKRHKRKKGKNPDWINAQREIRFKKCHPDLRAHSEEFKREIISLADGRVQCAVGFGLANCILLEGTDGCVMIDTLETSIAAQEVLDAFDSVTRRKPVKAVILTHFHTDHVGGCSAVLKKFPKAKIFVHEALNSFQNESKVLITVKRAMFQFGNLLPKGEFENSGIGSALRFNMESAVDDPISYLPHNIIRDETNLNISGLELKVFHCPGETDDQICVWWPKYSALFPADNVYKTFPNLYAIRGNPSRDALQWANSVNAVLRSFNPRIVVPQHGRPFAENVQDILTSYGDAIRFVHDQTVRLLNKGLSEEEIVNRVKLPSHLAKHQYLQEFYGTVEWSVKAVCNHHRGCFDGRPTSIQPCYSKERLLRNYANADLEEETERAKSRGNLRWALKLTDIRMKDLSDDDEKPSRKVVVLRSECLRRLGEKEKSANGRNWYFTAALENDGAYVGPGRGQVRHKMMTASVPELFANLPYMINPETCPKGQEFAHFHFTDTDEHVVIKVLYIRIIQV